MTLQNLIDKIPKKYYNRDIRNCGKKIKNFTLEDDEIVIEFEESKKEFLSPDDIPGLWQI